MTFRTTALSFLFCAGSAVPFASPARDLRELEAVVPAPAHIVNQSVLAGREMLLKNMPAVPFTIPAQWRLVAAMPASRAATADGEVLLVFQDQRSGDVHSLSLALDHAVITGRFMVRIPAAPR